MSARERFKRRKAEKTPIGRLKLWYADQDPMRQKLIVAGAALAGILVLGGVVKAAGGGKVAVLQRDLSDQVLDLDSKASRGAFGYGVRGVKPARYQVSFRFSYLDGRATLSFDAGWIDSSDEVEIRLNEDHIVGHAPVAINSWERGVEITLPYSGLIQNDYNVITFDNTHNPGDGPDDPWAIKNVRVVEQPLPEPDPAEAQNAFKLAKTSWDQRKIAPENLYMACKKFQEARDYLERLEVKPPLYDAAGARAKECKQALEKVWRDFKFSIVRADQYHDYEKAKGLLEQALRYFPDETDPKHMVIKEKLSHFR